MLEKLQKFGAAMFVPVLLFPFAGITLSIIIILQNPQFVGSIADPAGLVFKITKVLEEGAWTVFRHMPLVFAVGLPVGLATKAPARAVLVVLVAYLTFNYYVNTFLTLWGSAFGVDFSAEIGGISGLTTIAGIKTLDTSIIGAIVIAAVTVYIHNKFFDTKLPDFLGIFQGSSFVAILAFFVMFPIALLTAWLWPYVQHFILSLQGFMIKTGVFGVWLYTFLERVLIPTGLHHFIYGPFYFGPAVVEGGIFSAWMSHIQEFATTTTPLKSLFPQGGFSLHGNSKIFGLPGVAMALYATAKPENRKILLGLLIPATLTSVLAGITEPLEFTFLFIAPMLFVVHSILAATLAATLYSFGVVGLMGGGAIEVLASNWIPMFKNHTAMVLTNISIGLIFTCAYCFIFRFLILKFDLKTPGRTEAEDTKLYYKKDYKDKKAGKYNNDQTTNHFKARAIDFLEYLGGKENISSVTNCASRLRVIVVDPSKVMSVEHFKSSGAHGVMQQGTSVQVIIGLDVPNVREEFEHLL